MSTRLVLRSAQISLIAGCEPGWPLKLSEGAEMADADRASGLDTTDTAVNDNGSEICLGSIDVMSHFFVSKMPAMSEDQVDASTWCSVQFDD